MTKSIMLLSMLQYDLKMVIQTSLEDIVEIESILKNHTKSRLKKILIEVKTEMVVAQHYFDKQKKLDGTDQRYKDYCNDCLIFAVINQILFNKPLQFVHPDSFENLKMDSRIQNITLDKPDYVSDIPTIQ